MAASYSGPVILGLNRRLDNQPNTIQAAALAKSQMPNLDAIELGNEPNCELTVLRQLPSFECHDTFLLDPNVILSL